MSAEDKWMDAYQDMDTWRTSEPESYSPPQPIQSSPRGDLERILSQIQVLRKDLNSVIVLEEEVITGFRDPEEELKPGEEIVRSESEIVRIGSHMEESTRIIDRGGGDTYPWTDVTEVDDYEDRLIGFYIGRTRKTKPDIEKIALAKSELKLMTQNKKWHSVNYLLGVALEEARETPPFDYSILNFALQDLAKRRNDEDAIEDLRVIYGIPKSTETPRHSSSCYLQKIRMKAGELLGISEADILGRENDEFGYFPKEEQILKIYRESTVRKYRKDAARYLSMNDKHPILTSALAVGIPLALGAGAIYFILTHTPKY